MPTLAELEGRQAKREAKNQAKKDDWTKAKLNTTVTFQQLIDTLDRYDHTHIGSLRDQVAWLLLPWYKRHWYNARSFGEWVVTWPQLVKLKWFNWQEARARRAYDRKLKRLEDV